MAALFDHSAPDGADDQPPPRSGPGPHHRRRRALAVLALVSLVLGIAVGSSSGHHDSKPVAKAKPAAPRIPARKRGWVSYTGPVPILMYHGVDSATDPPLGGLQIQKTEFLAELKALKKAGYQAVTLKEVDRAWSGLGKLPKKPVVLSFDDGFHSQEKVAFPAMKRMGWPGVLNLAVNNLTWARGITYNEAQAMIDGGWELGSHTINHIDLSRATSAGVRHELVDSKRILEATFQTQVRDFCYPGGANSAAVQEAVKKAGYSSATTVDQDLATSANPFHLGRLHVDPGLGGAGLVAKLARYRRGDPLPSEEKPPSGPPV